MQEDKDILLNNGEDSIVNIFSHDGKYTYPSAEGDSAKFYRNCMVGDTPSGHCVWVYYNKQYTIREESEPLWINNYYKKESKAYVKMNILGKVDFFKYCEETAYSIQSNKVVAIHENVIYIDENTLEGHDIIVTYEKGKKLILKDSDPEKTYGKIPIKKNNKIKNIHIIDKQVLERTLVTSRHKLNLNIEENMLYDEEEEKLFVMEKCSYSRSEKIVRNFISKKKDFISTLGGYICLEGNRQSHNTDDWLNIKTGKVEHFQGSRYEGIIYGLKSWNGKTMEEAILRRALSGVNKMHESPKNRFQVNDMKFSWESKYGVKNDETGELIPFKEVVKLIKENDCKITISIYELNDNIL